MDAAAIGVIVRAARDLGDGLRLAIPRGSQGYRMLELTGLTRVLHIFEGSRRPGAARRGVTSVAQRLGFALVFGARLQQFDRNAVGSSTKAIQRLPLGGFFGPLRIFTPPARKRSIVLCISPSISSARCS